MFIVVSKGKGVYLGEFLILQIVMSILEFSEDMAGEMVFDLTMAGHGLADSGARVLIPIMTSSVPDQHTSVFLDPANEIDSLHLI